MTYTYILDTNVFAQAHRFYYPFDVVPGFWTWLDREHDANNLCSTRFVFEEIIKGDDQLVDWAKHREGTHWFELEDSKEIQESFAQVVQWISDPKNRFSERVQEEFLDGADPWIIAKAMAQKATVVTHEKFDLQIKRKILIPVVCQGLHVPYTDIVSVMRVTGAKLGLN